MGLHGDFFFAMVVSVDTRAHPLKTLFKAAPRFLLLANGFDRWWFYNVRDLGVSALVVDIVKRNPIQLYLESYLEILWDKIFTDILAQISISYFLFTATSHK